MGYLLSQAHIPGQEDPADLLIENGQIIAIAPRLDVPPHTTVWQLDNCFLFPGFTDVHVHLREPGFSYKETIASGTAAAAHGGFTTVCSMPNLRPAPDSRENLRPQLDIIRQEARVRVLPYGAITQGQQGRELADMAAMAEDVAGFRDDGRGVQDEGMMLRAMREAARLDKLIVAHCEDESLLHGGRIHDGAYAKAHNIPGISSASEWKQVERDIRLVRQTGCSYHVCHVSTQESVELIRQAQKEGLDVTGETAPHYLLLTEDDLRDEGRFRMNPPLRGQADREALRQAVQDGTISIIATDHAPHSGEEKAGGLRDSLMGIVGLEIAFPLLYTYLVQPGLLTPDQLLAALTTGPNRRFGINSKLAVGEKADLTVFDLATEYTIDPETFLSQGRATPFAGWTARGKCLLTIAQGRLAWLDPSLTQKTL